MRIHLFTTDPSALRLDLHGLGAEVTAVIVPRNRLQSEKVAQLRSRSPWPLHIHERGRTLNADVPPADFAIVWLYSQIFPQTLVTSYKRGMLNMHGGRIPGYRGASVLHWAIINGEDTLGITWHEIVEDVDAGPIWAESSVAISSTDTALDVRERMIAAGIDLLPTAWTSMTRCGRPCRIPDLSGGRVWPQRKDADGLIGVGWSERRVRDMVRALCPPWPRATLMVDGSLRRVEAVVTKGGAGRVAYTTDEDKIIYLQLEE